MKLPHKFISFLGSKTLALWLIGILIVQYLTTAVWAGEAFGVFIINLGRNSISRYLYILFFINRTLSTLGVVKSLFPSKRKLVLRLPLYAGWLILLFSVFMSVNIRKSLWTQPLGLGDPVAISWEPVPLRIVQVDPALKKKQLRTENSSIFNYEPIVTVQDAAGERFSVGAFPPKRIHSSYFHILQFGIGPGVELKKDGKVAFSSYMALRLTPFGLVDTFEIPPYPYRFYINVIPNATIKKGRELARDYDLEIPRYHLEIVKGETVIYSGDAETERNIAFEGMTLRFYAPSDWVILEVASDPFLSWFVVGIFLIVAGAIVYPFSWLKRWA